MIRTVLGDTDISANVLMHEHIRCVSNDMLLTFGDKWLEEQRLERYAQEGLLRLKNELHIGIFVDGTPIDLGRNAAQLQRLSQKTGMHIVASTGLYYYPSQLTCQRSAETLAEWFDWECREGMEGTTARPGILKCAADGTAMTEDMKKRVRAMGLVQAKTGLPLYAHCSHEKEIAAEMISVLEKAGAHPERVILGHASRRMDTDYLCDVLRQGYCICIDQSWAGQQKAVAQTVLTLCERGYEDQLLFSHDRSFYNDFAAAGHEGLDFPLDAHIDRFSFLSRMLMPALRFLGCPTAVCTKFLQHNALRVLSI